MLSGTLDIFPMESSIEFKLFAPYNSAAFLKGCFSDWQDLPMEKDSDGYFRVNVGLGDGVYYYKFCLQSQSWFLAENSWVEITDPYATEIDDATQNSVLRIKEGDRIIDTYLWQHDDQPLPADDELVIYELHVGDFSGGEADRWARGQFRHVLEKLDYLCDLGINAIELMPINEYPGDHSWGYNPRHFFAVESSYGSTTDLKRLIDECHGRGIRVFLDGVYNHSESECPLTKIDSDYWFHHEARDPDNYWGPEFNYDLYDESLKIYPARSFIRDVVCFWIKEYHIDGIRYDAVKQIDNYDVLHHLAAETKKTAGLKPFFNIAEHIPDTPKITNLEGPMDACWHDTFYHTLTDYLCQNQLDWEQFKAILEPRRRGYMGVTNIVNYLTNHDHNHLMAELGDHEIFAAAAFKRVKLGAVLLFTAVGVPMVWMGEEFGEYKPKTIEQAKLDWLLLGNADNEELFQFYRGLVHLRRENHALRSPNIDFFHEDPDYRVLAFVRWDSEGSRVVVIANLSNQFLADYCVSHFPAVGRWHEWTSDYDLQAEADQLYLDLPACEAKVLVFSN